MFSRLALPALLLSAIAVPLVGSQAAAGFVETPVAEQPKLVVGSDAPALSIEKWIKGTPVTSFEKGKVYMVEFWATWCGPCISSMPHLSELQKTYRDKGFTVISVTTEDPRNSLAKVEEMVAKKGDTMSYTVAWDKQRETKDAFFTAAGQRGIPCCFIVDGEGKIAYIGHPMAVDKTLEDVINKKHDIRALAARYKAKAENEAKAEALQKQLGEAFEGEDWAKTIEICDQMVALDAEEYISFAHTKFMILATKMNDEDKAYAWAREVHKGIGKNDARLLNAFAWVIVDSEQGLKRKDLDFALQLATDANTLTKGKDAGVLDTLARVHFMKGDIKKAVEVQTSAVEIADKRMKDDLQQTLDEYKAALEKKVGG
ncbi:MAG: redoxin family protein [Planctomycetes bacterium]|nr:redoxin family protein [Planctomycetota bacterium]